MGSAEAPLPFLRLGRHAVFGKHGPEIGTKGPTVFTQGPGVLGSGHKVLPNDGKNEFLRVSVLLGGEGHFEPEEGDAWGEQAAESRNARVYL